MKTFNKIVVIIASFLIIIGIIFVILSVKKPSFRTTILDTNIIFNVDSGFNYVVTVDKKLFYLIDVSFENGFPFSDSLIVEVADDKIEDIFNLRWDISTDTTKFKSKIQTVRKFSTFRGSQNGITCGSFEGQPGIKYDLKIQTNNVSAKLNTFSPRLIVRIHPADLEYAIVYLYVGFIFCCSGILFLIVGIAIFVFYKSKKHMKNAPHGNHGGQKLSPNSESL